MPSPRRRVPAAAALTLLAASLFASPAGAGGGVRDLLPDMRVARLFEFHVIPVGETTQLRFTTIMLNLGRGPLEIHGERDSARAESMPARQRIFRSDGSSRLVRTGSELRYEVGDRHQHWHVWRMQSFQVLERRGDALTVRRGAKTGYCFFDTDGWRRDLPGAPQDRVYREQTCGAPSSLRASMGLSVGWGDRYPWDFARQYVDISDLRDGPYRLCVRIDPQAEYAETNERNNVTWQDFRVADGVVTLGAWGAWVAGCR